MGTFDASRELPVWIGGLLGLLVIMFILWCFKRKFTPDAVPTNPEQAAPNQGRLAFFQVFASTFIACALIQDLSALWFDSFRIPVSAKYVIAICAALPRYILIRRG
jgi:hypothetical protein